MPVVQIADVRGQREERSAWMRWQREEGGEGRPGMGLEGSRLAGLGRWHRTSLYCRVPSSTRKSQSVLAMG